MYQYTVWTAAVCEKLLRLAQRFIIEAGRSFCQVSGLPYPYATLLDTEILVLHVTVDNCANTLTELKLAALILVSLDLTCLPVLYTCLYQPLVRNCLYII